MPEWAAIRNRPSASAAHRYTIDRHMIAVTSQLGRERPYFGTSFASRGDVSGALAPRTSERYDDEHYAALVLAGILHDIGKRPRVTDHAKEGERHARAVLERMGFDARIVGMATLLVREHLTLSAFAMSRNPNDPGVGDELASRVERDPLLLDMLFDLTKADMCSLGATSGEHISGQLGWSAWSAQVVTTMAATARAAIG